MAEQQPALIGIESIVRQTVEVPTIEEKVVKVQRTLEVEKRVPKIEIQEVIREVDVPEVVIVDKIVEFEEVQFVDRHVPRIIRKEVDRIVERKVSGPLQTRYIEKIVEQPTVVQVPKEKIVEKKYKDPVFDDQDIPVIAVQKIQPIIKFDPKKSTTITLKRFHPRIVPVEVEVEISMEEFFTQLGIDLDELKRLDGESEGKERNIHEGTVWGSEPYVPGGKWGTPGGGKGCCGRSSSAPHCSKICGGTCCCRVTVDCFASECLNCGRSKCCKGESKCCGQPDHRASASLRTYMTARRITMDELIAITTTGNLSKKGVVASSSPIDGPINPSYYNSWLLSLNYHLVNQPEVMKSLPWYRDAMAKIPFLPAGTPLPGTVMDPKVAREVGVSLPRNMPSVSTLQHHPGTNVGTALKMQYTQKGGGAGDNFDFAKIYEHERVKAEQLLAARLQREGGR